MSSRELQNDLRRPQNELRKSSRIALRQPVAPRGAAQAKNCKPPEREQQFHRPARSTGYPLIHAAPPVVRLVLSPSSLTFSHLLPSTSLPPRRTHGVGGFKWPAATAADPEGAFSTTFDWKCASTLRVLQTRCAEAVCGFLNIQRVKLVEVFVRSFGRWSQRLRPKFLSVSCVQEKEGRVEPTGSTLEPQPPVL